MAQWAHPDWVNGGNGGEPPGLSNGDLFGETEDVWRIIPRIVFVGNGKNS